MANRRILFSLLIAIFSLTSACAAAATPPVFEWERDASTHWRVLPDGEKTDEAPHSIVDAAHCTVCGSDIWVYEDGSADIYDYDGVSGEMTRATSLDANGELISDLRYVYTYDDEGHVIHYRAFSGDTLRGEVGFTVNEDGIPIPLIASDFDPNGGLTVSKFDDDGNIVHMVTIEEDGFVSYEEYTEYAQTAGGYSYVIQQTSFFPDGTIQITDFSEEGLTLQVSEIYEDGASFVIQYNQYFDPIVMTTYLPSGEVEMVQTYEYEYADDLTMQLSLAYIDGVLVTRTEYAADAFGFPYPAAETVYSDDGSYVLLTFSENGDILTESVHAADGTPIE